jgi:hypothetical protein
MAPRWAQDESSDVAARVCGAGRDSPMKSAGRLRPLAQALCWGHILGLPGAPVDAAARQPGAWAYADLQQFTQARGCMDEALKEMELTKETWFEPEVNRIAGEIVLKSPKPEAAEANTFFERALTMARDQGAKSWELRAAISLARLWRDQGKQGEARELLATVYGWFSEGFETLDLREANALLNTLQP